MNPTAPLKFHMMSARARIALLRDRDLLSGADADLLKTGEQVLTSSRAEKMIENVIGVFGLPLAVAPGFVIDGVSRTIPLVVEEASIVAALSSAAKLSAPYGGFVTEAEPAHMVGQIQIVGLGDLDKAAQAIRDVSDSLIEQANASQPKMVSRGGGVRAIETRMLPEAEGRPAMLVVHLIVDTCDAMGANITNTLCETISPLCERATGGRAFLRILSNLTDRARVTATLRLPPSALGVGAKGVSLRDAIVLASQFADADPYRAVTHNKGIMNGIDAVAIAVGNDWRAIEAAAHGYAARETRYRPLSRWRCDRDGSLVGRLELPLKVGTRGGNFDVNPAVALSLRILGVHKASELASILAAVGLAQNFSALRALAGGGIQAGHMRLHARSVAASAGAPTELFDEVVERLVSEKDIKVWRAQNIIEELTEAARKRAILSAPHRGGAPRGYGIGHGKVLLAGEHAVVYGAQALAVPVSLFTAATVTAGANNAGPRLIIPAWDVDVYLKTDLAIGTLTKSLMLILRGLNAETEDLTIAVDVGIPRAMGLGGSAALAVAIVRALVSYLARRISEDEVIALAFEAEKVAHGTPSGVDNALAALGRPLTFVRGEPPLITPISLKKPCTLVIGLGHHESLTSNTVAQVRQARAQAPELYDTIFATIDSVSKKAQRALEDGDAELLGAMMNLNHGLLSALAVSTPELEEMIGVARKAGALGAKLTGGGGGGAIVALVADADTAVSAALEESGYRAITLQIAAYAEAASAQGGVR